MFLALMLSGLILPHKFHTSLTRITHNQETHHLEIEMRVFTQDLERAVSQRAKKRTNLEHSEAPALAFAYVKDHLHLKRQDKNLPLKWVGLEVGIRESWIFLEVPMKDGLEGLEILNTMLSKSGTNRSTR